MTNNCPINIQDIIERVLLFADEKSLASCTVVNHHWSALAIKVLWRSMYSLRPLLGLLAPLQVRTAIDYLNNDYPIWGFDPAQTETWSWERFNFYAMHVRSLYINHNCVEHYTEIVITRISLYRESLSLLPNLKNLTINCYEYYEGSRCYSVDFAILFLSKSVRNLSLCFDNTEALISTGQSGGQAFSTLFSLIPKRAPDIRSIRVQALEYERSVCTASWTKHGFLFADLLPRLGNLEELHICPTFARPDLFISLSDLRGLKHINLRCNRHSLPDLKKKYQSIASRSGWKSLRRNQSALISLRALAMNSNFTTGCLFLTGIAPPDLTTLRIMAKKGEGMERMLQIIGHQYHALEKLHLESSTKNAIDSTNIWRFDTFQPLTSLTKLKHFSCACESPVYLSKSDFENLVSHWPLLEELHITPPYGTSYLTPHALALLAKYCPSLHSLTISIDWGTIETMITGDLFVSPEIHSKYKLSNVTSVDFGWSPVQECQTAAITTFLVDLSISSSAIQLPDIQTPQQTGEGTGEQEKKELLERWEDIKKFMTIAAPYRHQIQCLQKRIDNLEAQT